MTQEEMKALGHAFFDGKTLQYKQINGLWKDWRSNNCPAFISNEDDGVWRIKPDEPKKYKMLAFMLTSGSGYWVLEGSRAADNCLKDKQYMRIPELDHEFTSEALLK